LLTDSDERMEQFKAAIRRSRDGDFSTLVGIEVTPAELLTISALAKASDDAYTFRLTQRLLNAMSGRLRR
jgi:hypothetical protein